MHRQTDRQADRILIARSRLHSMQRGKTVVYRLCMAMFYRDTVYAGKVCAMACDELMQKSVTSSTVDEEKLSFMQHCTEHL